MATAARIDTRSRGERPDDDSSTFFQALRYLGQLDLTYLACEADGERVDQHAAHERAELARFAARTSNDTPSRRLLFRHVRGDRRAARAHRASAELLARVGFEAEIFGKTTIALKAVPAGLRHGDPARLLGKLLEEWANDGAPSDEERVARVLGAIACHSVVRAGEVVRRVELAHALADQRSVRAPTRVRVVVGRAGQALGDRRRGRWLRSCGAVLDREREPQTTGNRGLISTTLRTAARPDARAHAIVTRRRRELRVNRSPRCAGAIDGVDMKSLLPALVMIPAMTLLAHAQPGAQPAPAVAEPPPTKVSPAPAPQAPGELDALTQTARNVARDGRCEALPAIAQRVRELDDAYYQRAFAIDPTIAGCRRIDPSVMRHGLPRSQTVEQPPAMPFQPSGETGKDPGTAFWASGLTTFGGVALAVVAGSAGSTALGDVAALLIFVGPTVGHTYAGNTWNTGLGVRLAGAAGTVVGLGLMLRCVDGCSASDRNVFDAGIVLALGGSLAYLIGSLYEIATASEAAHEYNREHGIERALTFAPIQARGGSAPGLALVGRF